MPVSMSGTRHYRALPRRLRRPSLLVVGCGDVGRRLGAALAPRGSDRLRVVGVVRDPAQAARLREAGIVPLVADLDRRASLARLRALAHWMIDLAPPPDSGPDDPRTARLLAALRAGPPGRSSAGARRRAPGAVPRTGASPRRWVYISTTGVYGDCAGARFDETRPTAPGSDRAGRRVDAERHFRAAARAGAARPALLRVPGIYAQDRLPLERLRQRLPALSAGDDVYTNHVHADDLARIAWTAVFRGRPARVVHAVDDTDLKMGDYFDRVADAFGLPRPPRLARAELAARVSPVMLSFMSESRRLRNERLKRELRVRLRYPDVDHLLSSMLQSQAAR